MNVSNYAEWDECPENDECKLIASYLELVDAMIKDIRHLKAETIRARYELSRKYNPDHQWSTTVDILSNLDTHTMKARPISTMRQVCMMLVIRCHLGITSIPWFLLPKKWMTAGINGFPDPG